MRTRFAWFGLSFPIHVQGEEGREESGLAAVVKSRLHIFHNLAGIAAN